MKYLKNLPNHNVYESFINSDEFTEIQAEKNNVISFCKQEEHVHYNPYIPPPPPPPKALDILYSDNNGNLSYTSEVLPITNGKTPIALCIAGQNFFGDNEKARWMSLKYMNCDTPETGSLDSQAIYQGTFNADTANPNIKNLYNTTEGYGFLTADGITGTYNKIPSLYDINNNWNLTQLGTINESVVTDIDGKTNTSNILLLATGQTNWQTDASITNSGDSNHAPAACCCTRYHTLGTQAGDWYLGGGAEISLIIVNKNNINNKLLQLSQLYNDECISSIEDAAYWTSTENFNLRSWFISNSGMVNNDGKNNEHVVVAMLQY